MWPQGMMHALRDPSEPPRNSVQKVFYYDCFPDSTASENTEQKGFIETMRSLPGWHIREGRLAGSRKDERGQKRVDVLLTVEMLSHAVAKNMDRAILIAGDDDFTPLVAELLRHGTYVELWSDARSESPYLAHHSDERHRMGLWFYWRLTAPNFREQNPYPQGRQQPLLDGGQVLRFATARGGQTVKTILVGGDYHFCIMEGQQIFSRASAKRLQVLDRFLNDVMDPDMLPERWTDGDYPTSSK